MVVMVLTVPANERAFSLRRLVNEEYVLPPSSRIDAAASDLAWRSGDRHASDSSRAMPAAAASMNLPMIESHCVGAARSGRSGRRLFHAICPCFPHLDDLVDGLLDRRLRRHAMRTLVIGILEARAGSRLPTLRFRRPPRFRCPPA